MDYQCLLLPVNVKASSLQLALKKNVIKTCQLLFTAVLRHLQLAVWELFRDRQGLM